MERLFRKVEYKDKEAKNTREKIDDRTSSVHPRGISGEENRDK